VITTTLAEASCARSSSSVAKPSSTPPGCGGSPRSSVTIGRRRHAGLLECLFAVPREADLELVGERPAHLRAQILVVVDHEEAGLRAHAISFIRALCIS
jgi:hypothetical protein